MFICSYVHVNVSTAKKEKTHFPKIKNKNKKSKNKKVNLTAIACMHAYIIHTKSEHMLCSLTLTANGVSMSVVFT